MHTKNANPKFQRHLPLGIGSIFVPVTVLHSSNCHAPLWNPQYTPLASVFLDYCSLWSAFCVPFDTGQILTWGAESCIMWILFLSPRSLPFSVPLSLGQYLAESPLFPRQTREKSTWTTSKHWTVQNSSFNCYYKMSQAVPAWYCSFCAHLGFLFGFVLFFCQKTEHWKKVPKKRERKKSVETEVCRLGGEVFNFCTPKIQSYLRRDSMKNYWEIMINLWRQITYYKHF